MQGSAVVVGPAWYFEKLSQNLLGCRFWCFLSSLLMLGPSLLWVFSRPDVLLLFMPFLLPWLEEGGGQGPGSPQWSLLALSLFSRIPTAVKLSVCPSQNVSA